LKGRDNVGFHAEYTYSLKDIMGFRYSFTQIGRAGTETKWGPIEITHIV